MPIELQRLDAIVDEQDRAGFGALQSDYGNLPLKQLGYHASVVALAVRTTILQTYYNPFDQPIEAIYIFPIEGQQAVVSCELRIGDRVVRAKLKERGQARADYRRAIQSGHRAALLEENRPETFSIRVGNIPPGEAIQVCIETVGQLPVVNGEWTLRMPLVVAPRYTSGIPLPGGPVGSGTAQDTNQVPDASTVTPPTWLPGFASPVDLKLQIDLRMGDLATDHWIDHLRSSLHSVLRESDQSTQQSDSTSTCRIKVIPGERVDRDFILRGKLDDSRIQTSLTVESLPPQHSLSNAQSTLPMRRTFAMNIVPPRVVHQVPRDVFFLLDRSGSMAGWKMSAARRGISRLVDSLLPTDRFQVVAFDEKIDNFCGANGKFRAATTWQDATDTNRYEATRWLSRIDSRGGTEMGPAIERGLHAYKGGPLGRNSAIVLVTDGQITGEDALLRLIGTIPESSRPRLFCLGIDRAVNGSVLQRLAAFTGGSFELVESEERLDEVLRRFADEMGSPVVTNLKIETASASGIQLAPANVKTLYSGRSLTVYGRSTISSEPLTLTVSGLLSNGEPWSETIDAKLSDVTQPESIARPIFLPLWGKARVRQLEDELVASGARDPERTKAIVDLSLECNVLSRLTAFVAVDETESVAQGEARHSLTQPVEYPEGWQSSPPPVGAKNLIPLPALHGASDQRQSVNLSQSSQEMVADHLLKQGLISTEQSSEAQSLSKQTGGSVGDALVKLGYATTIDVARAAAEASRLPFVDARNLRIDDSIIQLVPESVARENCVIPVAGTDNSLSVLIADPFDLETVEKLRFILNRNILVMIADANAIVEAIQLHYGETEAECGDSILQEFTDTQIDFTESEGEIYGCCAPEMFVRKPSRADGFGFSWPDESDEDNICFAEEPILDDCAPEQIQMAKLPASPTPADVSTSQLAPVVRLVNLMILEAYQLRASHILFEQKQDCITIWYVIDGKPVERDSPPIRLLGAIISRFKILAKLDIADRVNLQSGKIRVTVGEHEVDLEIHTVGKELLIVLDAFATSSETPSAVQQWWKQRKDNK